MQRHAPGQFISLELGQRELEALARQVGLLGSQEHAGAALLEFGWAVVHACARIGDGYWRDDASAGEHIRAVFYD